MTDLISISENFGAILSYIIHFASLTFQVTSLYCSLNVIVLLRHLLCYDLHDKHGLDLNFINSVVKSSFHRFITYLMDKILAVER